MFALVGVVVLNFLLAVLRFINLPVNLIFIHELSIYLHAITIMLAMGIAMFEDRHVRLDILRRHKRYSWIETIAMVGLAMPFLIVVLVYGGKYAWDSIRILEASPEVSGLPALFVVKSLIVVFAALMILATFMNWIRGRGML